MKTVSKYIFFLLFCFLFTSCDEKFEELNTNPNIATDVNPGLILPKVIEGFTTSSYRFAFEDGMLLTQHLASINDNSKDRYFWGPNNTHWATLYDLLRNVENIYQLGKESKNESYQAIGLFFRSFAYCQLTSSYGDIPYSEAISAKTEQVFTPSYDSQEVVFEAILADLQEANQLLSETGSPIVGDILYNGNLTQWKKLINSFRLRVLLRVSDKKEVSQQMQEIVSNEPLFESNADNAFITYLSTAPYQFYYSTLREEDFNKRRLSFFADSVLTALNDKRLEAHYRPTDASLESGVLAYEGIPNGLSEDKSIVYNGGTQFVSRIGTRYRENPIGGIGILMHYAELQFILAESIEKNLISGNADFHYKNGILADMEFLGLENNNEYLAQELVTLTSSSAENIEKIVTQKWMSMWGIGMEAWYNWRRTGFPKIKPAVDDLNGGKIPVRFLYPSEESLLNKSNYEQAIQQQGLDDINTKMWLLN